jgi:hypothetical protein
MSLRALLQAMNAPDERRARQIAATKRWKAKNPDKVKAQKVRRQQRIRDSA